MRYLSILFMIQFLVLVVPNAGFAHPPTEKNKLDITDCHYTSGGGGEKHYHENGDFHVELPCKEVPASMTEGPTNPFYIAMSFFVAGIVGAIVLAVSIG